MIHRLLSTLLPALIAGAFLAASPAVQAGPMLDINDPTSGMGFGTVALGSYKSYSTYRVTNTGDAPLIIYSSGMASGHTSDFSGSIAGTLNPGQYMNFGITFTPTAIGSRSATLEFNTNVGMAYLGFLGECVDPVIAIKGNGVSITHADTTPSASDFTLFNGAIQRTFTIQNTGTTGLWTVGVTLGGSHPGDFSVSGYVDDYLIPNATQTFTVSFSPTATGARTATVYVDSNASNRPSYRFNVSATAAPDINVKVKGTSIADGDTTPSLLDETDFDVALVTGEQVVSTYTIQNMGTDVLNISSVAKSGTHSSDFTLSGITTPLSVNPGDSTTFTVTFDPSAAGTRTATLTINSDDADEAAYDFAIKGRGANPGDLDPVYNPSANGGIYAMVMQPEGKTVVGGAITTLGGASHVRLGRVNADGTVDSEFTASATWPSEASYITSMVVQSDGSIIIGGEFTSVSGTSHVRIARLYDYGGIDTSFTTSVTGGLLNAICLQPDGKILIGGAFTAVNGTSKTRIARLNSDGTLDTGFTATANSTVSSIVVQPDGNIIIGGAFSSVSGSARDSIARLTSSGSLDSTWLSTAAVNNTVLCLALQPDGKVILGGLFTTVNTATRTRLARLNSDGTLDTGFNPTANSSVYSLTLQADGKILVGGLMTQLNSTTVDYFGRLNSNGTLDTSFTPTDANSYVYTSLLKDDGRIMIGGTFTSVQSTTRNRIAQLDNQTATQSLAVTNSLTRVEWLRGGSSPEASRVTFELSTNGGFSWSSLGDGTRITGGWELTGLTLTTGHIRARAFTVGGREASSAGIVETIIYF